MGRRNLIGVLGVDANCLIYVVEGSNPARQEWLVREVFLNPGCATVIDSLTIAELLVKPLRELRSAEVMETRHAIEQMPRLSVLPIDTALAVEAARIRATTGLKLPDAVHLAAAVAGGAQAFLTNDAGFKRASAFLPVLILDELIAGDATIGV